MGPGQKGNFSLKLLIATKQQFGFVSYSPPSQGCKHRTFSALSSSPKVTSQERVHSEFDMISVTDLVQFVLSGLLMGRAG